MGLSWTLTGVCLAQEGDPGQGRMGPRDEEKSQLSRASMVGPGMKELSLGAGRVGKGEVTGMKDREGAERSLRAPCCVGLGSSEVQRQAGSRKGKAGLRVGGGDLWRESPSPERPPLQPQ